jgi:hypothetical protein
MRIAAREARRLKVERKTGLSANTLDIRRNCRHTMLDEEHRYGGYCGSRVRRVPVALFH